jgi:adenosylmethionine-8-amino-7-oxononanoate aminotransferase
LQLALFHSQNDSLWYPCPRRQGTRTDLDADQTSHSAVLHRDTRFVPKKAVGGKGSYIFLEDGQKFLDSTGGAGVSCLGHGHDEINKAVISQINQLSYCHSAFFGTQVFEDLASFLVDSTGGKLSKLFVVSSGLSALRVSSTS